ncbi:hypothetical protein KFV09_10495 [Anoxybacillus rupiensis]|nr:hypothetical protein [Anoxybacillus rupiensis]MBS2771960.1 hypothetical protein [Anoxybacillus rupiensis]
MFQKMNGVPVDPRVASVVAAKPAVKTGAARIRMSSEGMESKTRQMQR